MATPTHIVRASRATEELIASVMQDGCMSLVIVADEILDAASSAEIDGMVAYGRKLSPGEVIDWLDVIDHELVFPVIDDDDEAERFVQRLMAFQQDYEAGL